ncbi:amidohydrolase [Paeniglutamicibacter sp. ZC-3]|uniref:amidohydrolase n=1 Tax=Paeniglutamicibacter sp. ZC-3 TaxID=2986919 RepID=UPI0021F7085E|nr:amidohydrolase [Paeniglutamicibacter sp. ZC-3]MCV9993155.1 amidohydrolase [Paeniglutamicibacter sp. ZC-3]
MQSIIVYPARTVRTMDPARPTAEAVAVRGERIRAVGSVAELMAYPDAVLDERYADAVLLPGFVEAHSHAGSGNVWDNTYVGLVDRIDPDGRRWPGCRTIAEVLNRLRAAAADLQDPEKPLLAWGLDPIYFPGQPLAAAELDRVSASRPIHVAHTNGHVCAVNSAVLRRFGIDESTRVAGVVKDDGGEPTGELQEFAAMGLVAELVDGSGLLNISPDALRRFAQEGINTGTTTLTDLGSGLLMDDDGVALYGSTVDDGFPARLNVFHFGAGLGPVALSLPEAADRLVRLRGISTDKLRFGNVKLMLDGSIQGFTARLLDPGYFGGQPNGIWNVSPEQFRAAFETFHAAGLLVHVHCNGDQATQLFLGTLEDILTAHPRPDHRHTCTHSQLSTAAQYRRMAALGVCANIFANHIWAWGDQHLDVTVGPDRAARMNAAATALRHRVPISLHSDTPVTPLGPLHAVKHAVTRLTVSGRVMGEHERITVQEALEAVTLGGAYMLKMDHEVGSLEAGKFADMAVLAQDPLAVPAEEIGSIHVLGTVVGGRHHTTKVAAPCAVPAP